MLKYDRELITAVAHMVPSILGAHEKETRVHHFCGIRIKVSKNSFGITFGGREFKRNTFNNSSILLLE